MTEQQEREFKEYLSNLDKDTLIDLYLQKCFDTDVEKKELEKELEISDKTVKLSTTLLCNPGSHPAIRKEIENFSLISGVEKYLKEKVEKEIQSDKTKYQPAPALIYPKLAIGTKVKVYRAFQGYCGIGIIKKGFPTGLTPYYEIQLIKGNYGGFKAPTICYANENNVEVVNGN